MSTLDQDEDDTLLSDQFKGLMSDADGIDREVAASSPAAVAESEAALATASMSDMNAAGIAGVLEMALPLITPLYPSLESVYTPDVRAQVAAAMGPLLAKYGVNLSEMGGKYREEITAAFVCVPVAVATYKGIKADIESRAKQPTLHTQPAAPALPDAAGNKPGDFGYREPALGIA